MLFAIILILIAAVVGEAVLLVRAAKRLLQYDDIWQQITPILEDYSADLRKTLKSDLLIDNPEVVSFHKRNQQALKAIESIVDSVVNVIPVRKRPPVLPRPDVVG